MSITRLNTFKALPGRFEDLTAAFTAIVAQIRTLEGNLSCDLLLKVAGGADDGEKLVVHEVWESIEAHKRAASAIDPAQFTAVMALLADRPSGQYYTPVAG